MLKALAALAIILASVSAALAQAVGPATIACNASAIVPAGTAGPATIIPSVAGKRIFICGWNFTSSVAANTVTLLTAGGVNCATAGVALTAPLNLDPGGPNIDHIPYAQMQTAVGEKVCVTVVGTPANVVGLIWYSQF